VKPRKGRQNQGEFPRRDLILSPRWGSREQEGPLDPGLAPWAKLYRPSGPFPSALNTLDNTLQTTKLPKPHFCVAHPWTFRLLTRDMSYDSLHV
jgi:hypothetical protein